VLRDISMQTRRRFPALETIVAAGLMTKEELAMIERIDDEYSRYWAPIQWCYAVLYEARLQGKIASDHLMEMIAHNISDFRHGISVLLKYDWVPVPLVYPQVVFLAVRLYFIACLFGRQLLVAPGYKNQFKPDFWIAFMTVVQFIVYVGWMKVAEALLNPLGDDDDDLECNYIIDKNLITGMTLVDRGGAAHIPELKRDQFWDETPLAPLYSLASAQRKVHPLIGSVSRVNMTEKNNEVIMTPHKNKLTHMDEHEQQARVRKVNVSEHNLKHERDILHQQGKNADAMLKSISKGQTASVKRVAMANDSHDGAVRIDVRHNNGEPEDVGAPTYSSSQRGMYPPHSPMVSPKYDDDTNRKLRRY